MVAQELTDSLLDQGCAPTSLSLVCTHSGGHRLLPPLSSLPRVLQVSLPPASPPSAPRQPALLQTCVHQDSRMLLCTIRPTRASCRAYCAGCPAYWCWCPHGVGYCWVPCGGLTAVNIMAASVGTHLAQVALSPSTSCRIRSVLPLHYDAAFLHRTCPQVSPSLLPIAPAPRSVAPRQPSQAAPPEPLTAWQGIRLSQAGLASAACACRPCLGAST
jgi:hypothetical protein